jgi:hypothetical protein
MTLPGNHNRFIRYRTNNACETWNSRFNKQLNEHKQGFWRLVTELRRYETVPATIYLVVPFIFSGKDNCTYLREEKRALSDRELALNGDRGPMRRPRWRLVEATYAR